MKHENLVQFFGVCVEPPNVCLVIQYCMKGSLKVSATLRTVAVITTFSVTSDVTNPLY